MPTIEEMGAWALTYFRDCPAVTISTNEDVLTFKATEPRDGVKLNFGFGYLHELRTRVLARDRQMASLTGV